MPLQFRPLTTPLNTMNAPNIKFYNPVFKAIPGLGTKRRLKPPPTALTQRLTVQKPEPKSAEPIHGKPNPKNDRV